MGPWDSPPFLWLRSWQVCLVNGSDGPYFQLCGVDGVQQQLSPYSRKAAKVGTDNTFPKGRGWLCANKTLFTKQAASMVSSFYSTAAGTEVLWETHTKEGCVTLSRWQGWEKQSFQRETPKEVFNVDPKVCSQGGRCKLRPSLCSPHTASHLNSTFR